jgi:hypothetical protein
MKSTKETPKGLDINLPSLSNAGAVVLTAESIINAFEKEARTILKRNGYPLTLQKLWAKKDEKQPSQINNITWLLWHLHRVRTYIKQNNIDMAVSFMTFAVYCAVRAKINPIFVGSGQQGGLKSGVIRRAKASPKKESWRVQAQKIRQRNPKLRSKVAIAKIISKRIGGNVDTIRKYI